MSDAQFWAFAIFAGVLLVLAIGLAWPRRRRAGQPYSKLFREGGHRHVHGSGRGSEGFPGVVGVTLLGLFGGGSHDSGGEGGAADSGGDGGGGDGGGGGD